MIGDVKFRLLFYRSMYEFKTRFWLKVSQSKDIKDSWISQERKEALQLVKMQFKLDVESQIDKDISEVLKVITDLVKSIQYSNRQNNKSVSEKKLSDVQKFEQINAEPILDFEVRNEWEKERNNNLSNTDSITLIVICSNLECNKIYPYSFKVEKELFRKIPCKFCKKNALKYYDVKTGIDNIFTGSKY